MKFVNTLVALVAVGAGAANGAQSEANLRGQAAGGDLRILQAGGQCFTTGCTRGGCPADFDQVKRERCGFLGLTGRETCCASEDRLLGRRIASLIQGNRFNDVTFENDDASIQANGDDCVILFRGSDEAADFKDNFDLGLDPIEGAPRGAKGHDGFVKPLNRGMREMIEAKIQQKCTGKKSVILGGHSRGGAMASAMGLTLLDNFDSVRVVTFGAPAALSSDTARAHGAKLNLIRYQIGTDVVPALNFQTKHIGKKVDLSLRNFLGRFIVSPLESHRFSNYKKLVDGNF